MRFLCLVLISLAGICSGCPEDWVQFQDYCLSLERAPATWTVADMHCRAHSAHLATLETSEKNVNLLAYLTQIEEANETVWIGGSDEWVKGHWQWVETDQLFSFTAWKPGQPAQQKGDCLALFEDDGFKWGSAACKDQHQFVCEKHIRRTDVPFTGTHKYIFH